MADSSDTMAPLAPQDLVTVQFGPSVIGWMGQLLLCGASSTVVWIYLRDRELRKGSLRSFNNGMLLLATLFNLICTGMNCDEIYHYLVSQNRSSEALAGYIPSDIWISLPQGLVALCAQSYFAFRCYNLIGRSKIFAGFIALPILASFADLELPNKSALAVAELWLWASAGTDILIAVVLTIMMAKSKRGFNLNTDNTLDKIIKLAVATAALPALVAIIAAMVFAFTYKNPNLFNTFAVFITILPSMYIFSYVQCLCFRAGDSNNSNLSLSGGRAVVNQSPIVFSMESATYSHAKVPALSASGSASTLYKNEESSFVQEV